MRKRGQLTIFIIVAVVIVTGILVYLFFPETEKQYYSSDFLTGRNLDSKSQTIRNAVLDCIETNTRQAIITIGVQGGRYERPEHYYSLNNGFFSYYYYEGEYTMPSIKDFEKAIEDYTENNLEECLNSGDYPIKTRFSTPIVKAAIKEDEVTFKIDSQITIEENNTIKVVELSEKEFSQESTLKKMIDIATYLTEYHKTDSRYFCINCLGEIAKEKEVNVDIYPFVEENTVHVIIHENRTNYPNLFILSYLNKYTGNEKSPLFDE